MTFKLYPAIDLIGGGVVRLTKGDFKQKTVYSQDPKAVAMEFEAAGAEYLHLVDLDGAKAGVPQQTAIFETIVANSRLKLQVGGGLRKISDVETLVNLGIDRIIIGSLAINDPPLTKKIFEKFGGERITLGLDVFVSNEGHLLVATHGWQEVSKIHAEQVLQDYLALGLNQVLCTDISRDGTLTEPNFELYQKLQGQYPNICFLASGGVTNLAHVQSLKTAQIGGAIVGRALYEGKMDLREALTC